MDRFGTAAPCRVDDGVGVQIRVDGGCRSDRLSGVGGADVNRARIGFRVDGNRTDAELTAGAHHAYRDLAAVGDKDALERRTVLAQRRAIAQSGMLPCFLGGTDCRLFSSMANAPTMRARVSDGRITSST